MDCIFCKIVAGDLPCARVWDDENHLAFLDLFPASRGHTLVIPKTHSKDILAMEDAAAGALMVAGHKIATAMVQATGAHGFNFHMCTHAVSGQTVFHTHLHIIPRYEGQEKILGWKPGKLQDEDRDVLLAAVSPLLKSH